MGIKVVGLDEVGAMLLRVENDGPTRVYKELYRFGMKVQHMAQLMAPYKYGPLTASIKISPETLNAAVARGAGGRFQTKEVIIYIDPDEPAAGGRRVGDYAETVLTDVTPAGELGLGTGSKAKQASNPEGEEVGGDFLQRAVDAVESEIDFFLQMSMGGFL